MYAREAVLNDPEIVKLVRQHFVAIAVDNTNNINLTPVEREWLSDKGGKACTQGMSVFTAGGKLLGVGGGFKAEGNLQMLQQALKKFRPEDEPTEVTALNEKDRDAVAQPPEGGLVLYVSWKVLGGYDTPAKPGTEAHAYQNGLGIDRLWVRKDEAEALVEGRFPDSLKKRMLRYHVSDVFQKVKDIDIAYHDGRVSGSFRSGSKGEAGSALGFVETKDGKVTRLDLLLKGRGERVKSHGFMAGLEIVPDGKSVPVALFFSLADPKDDLSRLPPHRTWRQLETYLR